MGIIDFTLVAMLWCIIALGLRLLFDASKLRPDLAQPKGSPISGIIYAFTAGMMPRAKESVSQHKLSFIAGSVFHLGILTAFALSIYVYVTAQSVARWRWPMAGILFLGIISGLYLLIKRVFNPRLRAASTIDDYFSNILVNSFMVSAVMALLVNPFATLAWVYTFFIIETCLLLYLPFSKLRHCVYFFATRIMFGDFYGRRGVLPHYKNQ